MQKTLGKIRKTEAEKLQKIRKLQKKLQISIPRHPSRMQAKILLHICEEKGLFDHNLQWNMPPAHALGAMQLSTGASSAPQWQIATPPTTKFDNFWAKLFQGQYEHANIFMKSPTRPIEQTSKNKTPITTRSAREGEYFP